MEISCPTRDRAKMMAETDLPYYPKFNAVVTRRVRGREVYCLAYVNEHGATIRYDKTIYTWKA